MNGIELAKEVRRRLGDRLIPHGEWGSYFPYSAKPSLWVPKPDKTATHHHGASAQLPRQDGTRAGAILHMRAVDRIHYVSNGWVHGFAYAFAILEGGYVGEGRSFWYPWGAHVGDLEPDGIKENIEAIPIYWAVGLDDGDPLTYPESMWEAADEVYPLMIELGNLDPREMYRHKDIQSTACPGRLSPIVLSWRTTGYQNPLSGVDLPDPEPEPEEDSIMTKLPTLVRTFPESRATSLQVRNMQAMLANHGYIAAHTFNTMHQPDGLFGPGTETALKNFQAKNSLIPDGRCGEFTWAKLNGV